MSINVTLVITTLIGGSRFPTPIPGNVCVWGGGGGFWLPVCTLLTTSRLRTSRYTEQRDIYHAENVTYIAHALVCEHISDT